MKYDKKPVPTWLPRILDAIRAGFAPEVSCGPLGFFWIPPANRKQPWRVSIFPTPGEVIEAGPMDGQLAVPGFKLDIGPVLALFDASPKLLWVMPSNYTGELDGPCIAILGTAMHRKMQVTVFHKPPAAFEPTVYFDRINNETRSIPNEDKTED